MIGITYMGLKSGLKRQSLGVKYVIAICETLNIWPNQFFGWSAVAAEQNNTQNGIMNQSIDSKSIEILQSEIEQKNQQINILLNILNKQ